MYAAADSASAVYCGLHTCCCLLVPLADDPSPPILSVVVAVWCVISVHSASSQVFFLLKESELTPSGANLLDGRYAVFGYVVQGQDNLGIMKVGVLAIMHSEHVSKHHVCRGGGRGRESGGWVFKGRVSGFGQRAVSVGAPR